MSGTLTYTAATTCEILRGGKAYFDKYLQVIEQSQKCLHLQVYIFNHDKTGKMVRKALIRAARRGVKVHLVLDGIGSGHLSRKFLRKFEEAGIEVRFFSKIRPGIPFRMGRRLHQKLLVADYSRAIVGGINIADRYSGLDQEVPWLDYAVYVEGPVCIRLHNLAVKILNKRNFKKGWRKDLQHIQDDDSLVSVRVLENDFYRNKLQIRRAYLRVMRNAQHSLVFFASYFLPGFKMLRLMKNAAKRGVEVRVLLLRKSDVMFYPKAVKYFYGRLLRAGIRLYEYPHEVMHAKVAAMDGQWCTIGSYNLNDLSDLLSIELNIEITDPAVAGPFQQELLSVIENECEEVPAEAYMHAPAYKRLLWRMHYFFMLLMLKLTYWLTDKNSSYQLE